MTYRIGPGEDCDYPDLDEFQEPYSSAEIRDKLSKIAEEAKAHWDSLGKPYPPHLQSLISFLEKPEQEMSET